MKTLRAAVSVILSGALVALSPGLAPYRAFAQTYTPAAAATPAVGGAAAVAGGVPVQLAPAGAPGALQLAPAPGLSQAAEALAPNLLSAPATLPTGAPAAGARTAPAGVAPGRAVSGSVVPATQGRVAAAAGALALPAATGRADGKAKAARAGSRSSVVAPTELERLRTELPDYGRMGSESARQAWDADSALRTGQSGLESAGSVETQALPLGALGAASDGAIQLQKSGKRMPERGRGKKGPHYEDSDPRGGSDVGTSDLDELGNPRREQDDGPDSVSDEFGGGGQGNTPLFGFFPGALLLHGVSALAAFGDFIMIPLYLGLVIPSLILHEMGHAKLAEHYGDPTARLQDRLSFKPKDLLTHIHPWFTVGLPLITMIVPMLFGKPGFLFGGARPVEIKQSNFLRPTQDMAKVAFAGPAVNFALAILGAFAYAGAVAMGLSVVSAILPFFVFFNVMLGAFNLIPLAPFDGYHIRKASPILGLLVGIVAAGLLAGGFLLGPAFLAGSIATLGGAAAPVQTASAALPALAAMGLMIGSIVNRQPEGVKKLNGPVEATIHGRSEIVPTASTPVGEPVTLLVRFTGAQRPLSRFVHMDLVPRPTRSGLVGEAQALAYAESYGNLLLDIEAAGLSRKVLEQYGAAPVASYAIINTATIVVPADKAAAFRAAMAARGFKVEENSERHIIQPVEPEPNRPDSPAPGARGAITLGETLALSQVGPAHEAARKLWGPPAVGLGFVARLTLRVLRLFGAKVPEVKLAVIDSGIDPKHPMMKHVELLNATKGKPEDDIGHGNWTHGTALAYAPWNTSSIHVKAFVNGSGTLDDILKALSMAREKGAIILSNSWGSDDGDPDGADTRMLVEFAKEGRVSANANGNAGSGKNTTGSPAIGHHVDQQSGAPRMLAVAATDRDKRVAYFSSRGPGSPTTAGNDKYKDWPQRPDLAEQGYNTEGPWPTYMRGDRTDPVYGPVKAISGTSMSTPKVAGTITLLAMLFGATEVGPKLDRVVLAVMNNLQKLGAADDLGKGFNVVSAAFAELSKEMNPILPGWVARAAVRLFDREKSGS